ncbi:hypothetical protein [Nocardioides nanhaiensis]|uniref:hypothetical protein n=1 Tax=Nocardioides nanhaiensis TaxID=1476871 RepID=UPI0031E615FA
MELLDDEGLAACPQRLCALPDGGSLLAGTTAARYTVSLVDLASDEGCSATSPDMRWTGRPLRASLGSATEFDCVLTDLEAGDSPLAETMTSDGTLRGVGLQIVDADGNQTCVPVGPCQGSGPYRLLVGGVRPATGPFREVDYRAVVRLLSEEAGCARISPRPFGTAADDRAPGSGCRVFTALTDHRYEVDVVEVATGQKTSGSLLGADGQDGCVGSLAVGCTPRRTGDLFVVHSLFGGDVVTGVHDLSDELGCRPQDLGTPAVLEARLGPGQRDCVIVDGTTGQGLISPLGEDHGDITLVASDGIEISCLTCVGPERLPVKAVLGRGDAQQATVLVPGDWRRRACAALGEAPSARAVQLTRTRRLGCLRLPFATDEPDALHVRRVAGTGSPATTLVAADRGVACLGSGPQFSYQALGSWTCDANDPGGAFDVLLLGDGGDQRVVVSRTPAFEPERPIAGLTQPRAQRAPWLPSRAVVGRALRAGTGRWTPAPRTYAYQWLVAGRPVEGATRRTFVPRPQHVGRRVQVRVTARAPGLFDGAALSRSVVVRRGR